MVSLKDIGTPASPYYSPYGAGAGYKARQDNNNKHGNLGILVTAFLAILATGGPTYSFGVYASTLKVNLQLTQSQLDTLGAASFAAGFVSWIPGLCVDAWGSRAALLVGGLGQSVGLWMYWIVARFGYHVLPPASWIPILCTMSVIIFTANNLVIGGVFKAIVTACGLGTKGKAVGAGKAYLGLGAGVFSCVFRTLHALGFLPSDLDFLAMSAVLAVAAIAVPAMLGLPKSVDGISDVSTGRHYNILYTGLFFLALTVVGQSAMFMLRPNPTNVDIEITSEPNWFPEWMHGVLIIFLWLGPIFALYLVPTTLSRKETALDHSTRRQKARQDLHNHEDDDENHRVVKTSITGASRPTSKVNAQTRLLLSPARPKKSYNATNNNSHSNNDLENASFLPPLVQQESFLTERDQEEFVEICETPQPVKDRNLVEMLQTVEAWLFLLSSTTLVGSVSFY